MAVVWLDTVGSGDLDRVGGKAASLGELTGAGLPVPPGFVVTADTYRAFIEETGIADDLFAAVDVDHEDSAALAAAHERAHELIVETPLPEDVRREVLAAYDDFDPAEPFVAVRSSATAEDLPDASFAGQQETFLNVGREALLDRVRECWASLFSERAIYYRNRQGFPHDEVDIAVVVQRMVDAEKSGVMFTSHPSTGEPRAIVEAAWGLGEGVVSGTVSPDNYVVERETGEVVETAVADKKTMFVRGPDGTTDEEAVPDDRREARVLSEADLAALVEVGERVESHYGEPQDVEWAMRDGDLFMLQSRPITTIESGSSATGATGTSGVTGGTGANANVGAEAVTSDGSGQVEAEAEDEDAALVEGLGASPGTVVGPVRVVRSADDLGEVQDGDVIVTEMTMPDMVPAMKRAVAIVTDEGGMTSHAAIVSRELGVPAVVGTGSATRELSAGRVVTVDGDRGVVYDGDRTGGEEEYEPVEAVRPDTPVKPMTATEVKVNVSIPEAAERAAATGADGVGLLRTEHMVLSTGKTPERFVADHGEAGFVDELVAGTRGVADEFYPRPVRLRTLDAPTDEFRQLEGGEDEPHEHNPMLGYRGIRRSLDKPDVFRLELRAIKRLHDAGYDNVEVMFPLVNDADDVRAARDHMAEAGLDPERVSWGVMIETPASALLVDDLAATGIDFVSFGTNDLTQYTLAVDRNNEHVADRFDEFHPAVRRLIGDVIDRCREHGVDTSICGQAGSNREMVRFLVDRGVSSISANIDAVRDVQHEVKRVEQRLILDSVR
jgi:pyruvate,water dikinase